MQCQCCVGFGFGVLTAHQFCRISLGIPIFGISAYVALESEVASTDCYVVFTLGGVFAEYV